MHTRGFTLIEMVITVALTTLIMTALGSLLVFFYRSNANVLQQASASMEARRGIDTTLRAIRGAQYAADGSAPISTAATSSIVLWTDTDNDDTLEQTAFTLTNGTLTRTVDGASAVSISTSVTNSTSTPVFRYYDSAGVELVAPITTKNIASVQTTLSVQIDPLRSPEITLSGRATLRNKK